MLRMGFIEDIEWILGQAPEGIQKALFSATMPEEIRRIAETLSSRSGQRPDRPADSDGAHGRPAVRAGARGRQARSAGADPRARGDAGRRRARLHADEDGRGGTGRAAKRPRLCGRGAARRPEPGAARERHPPAAQRAARPGDRHGRGGPRAGRRAHRPRGQLPHALRSRMVRPPHRPDRPGRSGGPGRAVRDPARAAPAAGHRAFHRPEDQAEQAAHPCRRRRAPGRAVQAADRGQPGGRGPGAVPDAGGAGGRGDGARHGRSRGRGGAARPRRQAAHAGSAGAAGRPCAGRRRHGAAGDRRGPRAGRACRRHRRRDRQRGRHSRQGDRRDRHLRPVHVRRSAPGVPRAGAGRDGRHHDPSHAGQCAARGGP